MSRKYRKIIALQNNKLKLLSNFREEFFYCKFLQIIDSESVKII